MVTKQKHTAETIMVYPVNVDKLNKAVNEHFHKDNPNPNITFDISGNYALAREPILALIDDEFIGNDVTDTVTLSVYKETKQVSGSIIGSCFPDKTILLTLAELAQYLDSPISLAEFTKKRRGYNSRIISNEATWMRHFNKS